jgi:hypothetical protein
LAEFKPHAVGRVVLDGSHMNLGGDLAKSLALVFHELAPNAAKYGSLLRQTACSVCIGRCLASTLKSIAEIALRGHLDAPRPHRPKAEVVGHQLYTPAFQNS